MAQLHGGWVRLPAWLDWAGLHGSAWFPEREPLFLSHIPYLLAQEIEPKANHLVPMSCMQGNVLWSDQIMSLFLDLFGSSSLYTAGNPSSQSLSSTFFNIPTTELNEAILNPTKDGKRKKKNSNSNDQALPDPPSASERTSLERMRTSRLDETD
ncbi:hypothetical protein VNO77_03372 [Canavalia gladiata]|uniref:Uncharacterized protein n=1 Tax=Canavalia gladiata TaxID=3824 RepID=A0AAN9R6S3_CANGL